MKKLFRVFLSAGQKRRSLVVGAALWILRAVLDIEKDELCRYSDKLDEFDSNPENVSPRDYSAIEEGYLNCECALVFLETAIEDLEFAY